MMFFLLCEFVWIPKQLTASDVRCIVVVSTVAAATAAVVFLAAAAACCCLWYWEAGRTSTLWRFSKAADNFRVVIATINIRARAKSSANTPCAFNWIALNSRQRQRRRRRQSASISRSIHVVYIVVVCRLTALCAWMWICPGKSYRCAEIQKSKRKLAEIFYLWIKIWRL